MLNIISKKSFYTTKRVPNKLKNSIIFSLKKMKYKYLILITILFLLGCDDSQSVKDLDQIIIPSSNVSFSEHIFPVLNLKCTYSGCHNDESRAGNYSVTTWSNVVQPGVVNPGDTTTSRLVWAIEGQLGSAPMPPINYPALTINQIKGIKTWIAEGARHN